MNVNFEVSDVVEIHDEIIKKYGGDSGIVSLSSLEFILDHSKHNPYEDDFFTLISKILQAITVDHPFLDGNKRTGLVILESVLEDNGLILSLDEKQKEDFILKVAKLEFTLKELKIFIEENCDIY